MKMGIKKGFYKKAAYVKQTVINKAGCFVAKWILHNCDDGLVIRRKGGAEHEAEKL